MTGLRDRKKQEVRRRIVQGAATLFADKGLNDTTMEAIAAAADVSVGTVYNYFGSKNALLLAGVEADTDEMITLGASVIAAPGTAPADAVKRLLEVYMSHLMEWDRRLLREVMSAAFQRVGGAELTAELAHMDQRLVEQLATLLTHFHDTGQLQADVEVGEAALLLFSAFAIQLFMFISMDGPTSPDLPTQVARQIDLAFDGLALTKKKAK